MSTFLSVSKCTKRRKGRDGPGVAASTPLLEWETAKRLVAPDKDTLIARFGSDALMPDVRHLIAQCPRKDAPGAACGVHHADLCEGSE